MRRHRSKIPVNRYMNEVCVTQSRFKHKAGDCGHSRCGQCHPNKFPKRVPTRKEVQHGQDHD